MPSKLDHALEEEFTAPGLIAVTASALQYAREFGKVVRALKGDFVVTFDWAQSMTYKSGPDAEPVDLGACLTLGAFERSEIPPGYTQTVDGLEFAIRVPRGVWANSAERLIDLDKSLFFKLALR
jgi:hypothetical protein